MGLTYGKLKSSRAAEKAGKKSFVLRHYKPLMIIIGFQHLFETFLVGAFRRKTQTIVLTFLRPTN